LGKRLALIQPVGIRDRMLLGEVVAVVGRELPEGVDVHLSTWILEPIIEAYDWDRRQYRADAMNFYLYKHYIEGVPGGVASKLLVVGIVNGDGYVEGLNFVFGLASPQISTATVYTSRLVSHDMSLTVTRISKEVIHELGHLLGLNHCSNPLCVMSFSNSVREVDRKGLSFCTSCALKLSRNLRTGR